MKLKFIGKDGSMGLEPGNTYEVELTSTKFYIVLVWKANHQIFKCPYSSLADLVENWSDT